MAVYVSGGYKSDVSRREWGWVDRVVGWTGWLGGLKQGNEVRF